MEKADDKQRANTFDFLRLLFASFIIITHAYPLSGLPECDPVCRLSNVQLNFSYIGLIGFFTISGYLITNSLFKSENLLSYFWKRGLRIYPALIVLLVLTVLLAPFVYENSGVSYLSNTTMWTYIPNNLHLYKLQSGISGVFENNPVKNAINVPLWTLCIETTLYILIAGIFFLKRSRLAIWVMFIALIFFVFADLFLRNYFSYKMILFVKGQTLIEFGVFFMGGSFLACSNFEKNKYKAWITIFSLLIVSGALFIEQFYYVKYLLIPLIIFIGSNSIKYLSNLSGKIGDLSFGIYIYSYPIAQTLQHFFKLKPEPLIIYTLVLSFIFGSLSWHLIEKHALKLKNLKFSFS